MVEHSVARLFSADPDLLLVGVAAVGAACGGLSLHQCAAACLGGGVDLARVKPTKDWRGLAGGAGVCSASGQRRVGGVDRRAKEYVGDVLLSAGGVLLPAI